ncbi:MAG: alpha-galactosidase [Acholeplasmataceae bacterium]|nr:alpha-galactosidase [Acholeplasmataceae bacterium]
MIYDQYPYFKLETKDLNYIFHVMATGQLEHLYFGRKLVDQDYEVLHTKPTAGAGSTVEYISEKGSVLLELKPLEYSGIGKGDFRLSPLEIRMPDQTFVSDFIYHSHEIQKGIVKSKELPTARAEDDEAMSLIIKMMDNHALLEMKLIYTVFIKQNVISRRVILTNNNEKEIQIRKIMSMMVDLPETDYDLITFDGGWIKEAHQHKRALTYGTYINDSTTGSSSNRHNPGIILAKKNTLEDYGICIGINLIYSGNHYEAVQISNHGNLRFMNGINPHCFEWNLKNNQSFETPEAILTYSDQGFNLLSHHFHEFINTHIVPRQFQHVVRPVVLNSWEAFFFDFNQFKLLSLARKAKRLGVELFVLDDGWFGNRNDDHQSLGDYHVNRKKLPGGITYLANQIHHMGMKFGLWFEPEMVNPKSKLYENHPEYAVKIQGRTPSLGRNQLVLDLCNPKVREYIKHEMSSVIQKANINYIKWDMNRHITDMYSKYVEYQGMFFHKYILGLYEILHYIRKKYPLILIETCSSGGNRFDLGMLTYGAQIWASDNTDPIERLKIQEGLSYLYPPSSISCHVSLSPHAQTLRKTPLSTRFNVASFGVLGYELNLKYVTPFEKKEMKKQIAFYKENREVFQFGRFYRFDQKDEFHRTWQISKDNRHILGSFQTLAKASPEFENIQFKELEGDSIYHIKSMQQQMPISQFGHLIAHALPIKLHPDGFIMRTIGKHKGLPNAIEDYQVSGSVMMKGLPIKQQFMGTYYNDQTRILGDFGSQIYVADKI